MYSFNEKRTNESFASPGNSNDSDGDDRIKLHKERWLVSLSKNLLIIYFYIFLLYKFIISGLVRYVVCVISENVVS